MKTIKKLEKEYKKLTKEFFAISKEYEKTENYELSIKLDKISERLAIVSAEIETK